MRVQITHLKAPWPEGAVVGDVLDLPAVPVWAVGKCKQVDDDVELTIVDNSDYVAPLKKDDDASTADTGLSADSAGAEARSAAAAEEAVKIAAALAEADKQAAEELAALAARKAKHK